MTICKEEKLITNNNNLRLFKRCRLHDGLYGRQPIKTYFFFYSIALSAGKDMFTSSPKKRININSIYIFRTKYTCALCAYSVPCNSEQLQKKLYSMGVHINRVRFDSVMFGLCQCLLRGLNDKGKMEITRFAILKSAQLTLPRGKSLGFKGRKPYIIDTTGK